MIGTCVICAMCTTAGLYAGKKRAKGCTWRRIAMDAGAGVAEAIGNTYAVIARQFRKDKPEKDLSEQGQ